MAAYRFRTELEPSVKLVEAQVLKLLHATAPTAELKRIGPLGADNHVSWSCWIITETDAERDRVKGDSALIAALWKVSSDAGFPPDSFTVQSHETVRRDYEGSWFYAMR
jgi:hypothetical protein